MDKKEDWTYVFFLKSKSEQYFEKIFSLTGGARFMEKSDHKKRTKKLQFFNRPTPPSSIHAAICVRGHSNNT